VVHLRGGSGEVKKNAAALKPQPGYYYAARARYLQREFGFTGLWFANVLWTAGMVLNYMCKLVTGRPVHLPRRGWRDIWIARAKTPAGERGVRIEPEVEPLFGRAVGGVGRGGLAGRGEGRGG
jgi:hypothetical protein